MDILRPCFLCVGVGLEEIVQVVDGCVEVYLGVRERFVGAKISGTLGPIQYRTKPVTREAPDSLRVGS